MVDATKFEEENQKEWDGQEGEERVRWVSLLAPGIP